MSNKKIMIWSLIAGLILNYLILYFTADIISCVVTDKAPFWISLQEEFGCYPYNGVFPISYEKYGEYKKMIEFGMLRFVLNSMFWSVIVWLVLMRVKKINKKQEAVQPNFDQNCKI